jgi:wobble nucleotide-excising tRNase
MSCEAEINPKWKYAIDSNICPFCGQCVMAEELKQLFSSLSETMSELQHYSSHLEDWMLSNYGFIKTDSLDLINYVPKEQLKSNVKRVPDESTKFTVKVKTDRGEEEIVAEKIQSDECTNSFFARAEAVKPNLDGFKSVAEKTQRLKAMAHEIKKAGSLKSSDGGYVSSEMLEQADPEAVAEMQSLMSEDNMISSSLDNSDDDDEIPDFVLNMANNGANNGPGGSNQKDLLKLQQMQQKIANSRKKFNNGGGGFSRAG